MLLLCAKMVEVTDATTWEMVIVLVIVAVDVRVVVEESASARAGRSSSDKIAGKCMLS